MTQQQQTQNHDYSARVKEGLDTAKDAATRAAARTSEGLEQNPLALLVGGVAVGALAGALIPRSVREKQLLKPVGARLGAVATAALVAAKEAGRSELDTRGLTAEGAKEKARTFFSEVGKAAANASTAAAQSARDEATHSGDVQGDPKSQPSTTPTAAATASDVSGFNSAV